MFYCKYCGQSSDYAGSLAGQSCSCSKNGRHEIFEGSSPFYCKYCGYENSSSPSFAGQSCSSSPTGRHEL